MVPLGSVSSAEKRAISATAKSMFGTSLAREWRAASSKSLRRSPGIVLTVLGGPFWSYAHSAGLPTAYQASTNNRRQGSETKPNVTQHSAAIRAHMVPWLKPTAAWIAGKLLEERESSCRRPDGPLGLPREHVFFHYNNEAIPTVIAPRFSCL